MSVIIWLAFAVLVRVFGGGLALTFYLAITFVVWIVTGDFP